MMGAFSLRNIFVCDAVTFKKSEIIASAKEGKIPV